MRLKNLVNYWDQHARGRLASDRMKVRISDGDQEALDALARQYPLKSREDLLRDLMCAALTELEACFPYREGTRVVARDEDGFEIYEDAGLTPRFLDLSKKYMKELKNGSRVA
ncbi:hypothetical protein DES49_2493 [Halospina denitrificans]|uniref:Type 1 pili tip component n=1 Tax=Halospina denitrificans TaxID=332522 RepID=A0A4R7JLY4_9GAMM|nr:pilin assembly protein [Halospina denitrificans]TDT38516.1 hypothetical protein DES49_2493 [Halospina denitrificans]